MKKLEKICNGNPTWYPKKDTCFYTGDYTDIKCNKLYNNRICLNVDMIDVNITIVNKMEKHLCHTENAYKGIFNTWCMLSMDQDVECD